MTGEWRERLGRVRASSSVDLLLGVLPGVPVLGVESAAALIGRSKARTVDAVNALATAGILRQRNVGKQRYRIFEAADVVDLSTGLEQALAGPTGITATADPLRQVPVRPRRSGSDRDAG